MDKWTSFALTCLLVFAINWGVNVTSYALPAEASPNPAITHGCAFSYGCSLAHLRLQPRSPTVAARLTYGCRYVLPAEAFPSAVRSSFFGCSACLGTLG